MTIAINLNDDLAAIRELPSSIYDDVGKLIVNRRGTTTDSFMVTERIAGHTLPGHTYEIQAGKITSVSNVSTKQAPLPQPKTPPHVVFSGNWDKTESITNTNATILGGLATLSLDIDNLDIPEAPATSEFLAYYGAHLLAEGDLFTLDGDEPLPISVMNIGSDYVNGYLLNPFDGGGAYLESHDRPHLHMPLTPDAKGHLILASRDGDVYNMTAFSIPYGFAVYTSPHVLHDDAFLIGRYMVIYSVTDEYSTVLLRNKSGAVVTTKVTQG